MDEPRDPRPTEPPVRPGDPVSRSDATLASDSPLPPVKLEMYEGPLDLLLDLIRKQEINIYDIPIAKVTKQYLDYLHMLEKLNLDVGAEFIFMAATLIYIKSRMLLPPDPTAPLEEEDPRTDLLRRLLEHEQFKQVAEMLQSKRMVEEAAWSRSGIQEFSEAEDEPGLAVSVFDLVSTFHAILERARHRPQIEIHRQEVTVAQMIEHVKDIFLRNPGPVPLEDLVAGYLWRQALIVLLLALLELVRLRAISIRQKELFGPIIVYKTRRFDEVLAGVKLEDLEASLGLDELGPVKGTS